MNKQEFLARLREGLAGLPQEDIEERLTFYSEMIDDRMEEGLSEEEAVAQIGSVEEILQQIVADTPLAKLVKEKVKPTRQLSGWEIAFLVLGSPIWLSLLIAAVAVALSLYAVVWSVAISLWAAFATVAGSALGGIAAGLGAAFGGNTLPGLATVSVGIVCGGLSVFMFYGCKAVTKVILWLTKKMLLGIKNHFVKKEAA